MICPAAELVVEGVVGGGRILVGADGREHVLLQTGQSSGIRMVSGAHVQNLLRCRRMKPCMAVSICAQGVHGEGVGELVALGGAVHTLAGWAAENRRLAVRAW